MSNDDPFGSGKPKGPTSGDPGQGFGARPAPLPGGGAPTPPPAQPGAPQRTVIGEMPINVSTGAFQGGAAPARPVQGGTPPPGGGANDWMGGPTAQEQFFPDQQAAPPPQQAHQGPKISLAAALTATESTGAASQSNPICGAAAPLLILFGRLRSQVVEMQAVPLMEHVTNEIEKFERNVLAAGISEQDTQLAKYALCGTADDIVQNIPGTDRHVWMQYSMVARFFQKRTSGVGFFQEVDRALSNPASKYDLLELMLTCLSLGFEGQYRSAPGGDVELQRVRRRIYETLRNLKARGDDDISPHWKGVVTAGRRNFAQTPIWVTASIAGGLLFGTYLLLRLFLAGDADTLSDRMVSIHPKEPVQIVRLTVFEPYVPPPAIIEEAVALQVDRITAALGAELADGTLFIDTKGDYILISVNNLVLFASGKHLVKPEFASVAERIVAALDIEPGNILVVGHTDSVPPSGRGRFKSNFDLSVARAQSVSDELGALFSDPSRLEVVGKGADEPIATNDTKDGQALNRRVEILLQREDTL